MKRIVPVLFVIFAASLLLGAEFTPAVRAAGFSPSASIPVNTATGSQLFPGYPSGACSFGQWMYEFWTDGASFFYASSQNGVTWNAPVNALTLTSIGTLSKTAGVGSSSFFVVCNGGVVTVLWTSINAAAGAPNPSTNFIFYSSGTLTSGSVTMGSTVTGPKTSKGNTLTDSLGIGTALIIGCMGYFAGHFYYCFNNAASTWNFQQDNLNAFNFTSQFSANTAYSSLLFNGNGFMLYNPGSCQYMTTIDPKSWPGTSTTISTTFCTTNQLLGAQGSGANGYFFVPTFKSTPTDWLLTFQGNTLLSTTQFSTLSLVTFGVASDDTGTNIVIYGCTSGMSCAYGYATIGLLIGSPSAFTATGTFTPSGSAFGGATTFYGATTSPTFSSALAAFPVETANQASSFFVYATVFGVPVTTIPTQTQTIGSCPVKNTATFTMANSTIYLYAGNALGSEVVNTVQVNVASITGSGSHTLELVIYVGTQQSISVNAPSTLAFQYTKTFSTGTKNQQFIVQVNIPLNTAAAAPLPFNWWAVGVIGDNKIVLNQSAVAGLQTVTGSAPPANQPLSFTALSSNVNMIALCATASYQSILPAITTTTTQAASTTSTIFTTSTSTISTIGATLFTTASNWPVIFLILLLPAGLFLGVTKNIAGALLGLMIGTIIGTMMGILPGWAFIGIVIALAAVAFIARERG